MANLFGALVFRAGRIGSALEVLLNPASALRSFGVVKPVCLSKAPPVFSRPSQMAVPYGFATFVRKGPMENFSGRSEVSRVFIKENDQDSGNKSNWSFQSRATVAGSVGQ